MKQEVRQTRENQPVRSGEPRSPAAPRTTVPAERIRTVFRRPRTRVGLAMARRVRSLPDPPAVWKLIHEFEDAHSHMCAVRAQLRLIRAR